MLNLNDYFGKELKIIRKSFWKREFLLMNNSEIIGKLYSIKIINDLFVCEVDNKEFEFYKKNFLGEEIFIRERNNELPFASFNSKFFSDSGELKLSRGRKLLIKIGFLKDKAYCYESKSKLLFFVNNKFLFKEDCIVKVENKSELLVENPWLILFVFYLMKKSSGGALFF
jgi:hypothetical protein